MVAKPRTTLALPAGAVARNIERCREDQHAPETDAIAEEVPIAILFNRTPFAVMMATPANLDDFALGFALTERIIDSPTELKGVRISARLEGIELALRIPPERKTALLARTRGLEGRSGCGICGSRQLEDVIRQPDRVENGPTIDVLALRAALLALPAQQPLNAATGATHAAAWCSVEGQVVAVREDVGRHNALDKLIGAISGSDFDPDAGFLLLTSRASYEMVAKAAAVGIAVVCAVSAATALAMQLADTAGVTLIGFGRQEGCTVYTHPHRFDMA
jgi:FdhD protein